MRIYIAHSRQFDYINKIYQPIRNDNELKKEKIILPHETEDSNNKRVFYDNIDLLIAEVSAPSIGLGIELGFAYDSNIPIYCLYEKGKKYSKSLEVITKNIIEYKSSEDFIKIIKSIIESRKNETRSI